MVRGVLRRMRGDVNADRAFVAIEITLGGTGGIRSRRGVLCSPSTFGGFTRTRRTLKATTVTLLGRVRGCPRLGSSRTCHSLQIRLRKARGEVTIRQEQCGRTTRGFGGMPRNICVPKGVIEGVPCVGTVLWRPTPTMGVR